MVHTDCIGRYQLVRERVADCDNTDYDMGKQFVIKSNKNTAKERKLKRR